MPRTIAEHLFDTQESTVIFLLCRNIFS